LTMAEASERKFKIWWFRSSESKPFVLQHSLPDLPAGGGVQDFFLHHRWVVEQPEEAYLDDPADDCIPAAMSWIQCLAMT